MPSHRIRVCFGLALLATMLIADFGAASPESGARREGTSEAPADRPWLHASGPGACLLGDRADTTDIVDHVSDVTLTVRPDGEALRLPYYANRILGTSYPEVTRAVIVINGTLRNADEYYQYALEAAQMSGGADSSAFIIAPQYLTEADLQHWDLPDDYAFWAYMGWRKGDLSLSTVHHPRPARLSSFAVADSILYRLVTTCPNLEQIVVAGHSAGGQFCNLYAAGTGIPSWILQNYEVPMRWIVGNPSCYIYFNEERWIEGTSYAYAAPSAEAIAECPTYNDYKYGVVNPNEYMSIGTDSLRARYSHRRVIYLLGELDVNPNDFYLERGCEAMLQGDYRLERGLVYWNYLGYYFGEAIWDQQALAIIPGVAHDGHGIFTSECGRYYLFDHGTCTEMPPVEAWADVTPTLLRAPSCRSVAWIDHDTDGDADLCLPATDNADLLADNDGRGAFTDVTPAVLRSQNYTMLVRPGDYDNDGLTDLYEVNWRAANRLLRNTGGGVFVDVTASPLGVNGDCTDAHWVDIDNDGDLDLYLVRTGNTQTCMLFRNDGASGFENISAAPVNASGNVRYAAWGDYDNDGWTDLFLAKDGADKLLHNDGDGTFTDVTAGPLGDFGSGTSAAWGDYDNDGFLDLYIVNRNGPNSLLHNDGDGTFSAVAFSPVNVVANGRSAVWGDANNDGWLDLYLCNDGDQNRLFQNTGSGFTDATIAPLDVDGPSYAAAWADYDGDGAIDLYLAKNGSVNQLFRNASCPAAHWLQLKPVGTVSNVSAVGTRVRLLADGRWQIREAGGQCGYMAEGSPFLSFGLGEATVVDSLVICWPSGIIQRFAGLGADVALRIVESEAPVATPDQPGDNRDAVVLRAAPNPLGATGTRLAFQLRESGPVQLWVVDPQGRMVRSLTRARAPAGRGEFLWDGRDESGRELPSGVYLARFRANRTAGTVRLTLIR